MDVNMTSPDKVMSGRGSVPMLPDCSPQARDMVG